jgi:hypothetical protein
MTDPVKRNFQASASENGDFVCIETYSGYRGGVRDYLGKQHLLPPDATDAKLGHAVIDALAHSRFVLPQQDMVLYDYEQMKRHYADWIKNLQSRYRYKSKRALFSNMRSCMIKSQDGTLTIMPSNHDRLEGWSGDGITKDDWVILPADSPPQAIGAALRLAFSRCI